MEKGKFPYLLNTSYTWFCASGQKLPRHSQILYTTVRRAWSEAGTGRARMGACRGGVGRTGGRREHVADSVLLDDAPIPELGDRRRSSVGLIGKARRSVFSEPS